MAKLSCSRFIAVGHGNGNRFKYLMRASCRLHVASR